MACFYSVCKEDQCARQCHMLLLNPERRRQSLGSWSQVLRPFRKPAWSGLSNLQLWEKCAGVQDAPGACNTHSAVRLGGSNITLPRLRCSAISYTRLLLGDTTLNVHMGLAESRTVNVVWELTTSTFFLNVHIIMNSGNCWYNQFRTFC